MQVQLTAVHPTPLQHGCWLLWTSKGASATHGSCCILTAWHNLFTYILQEKKGLQARETTKQLTMLCLEECPSPVHASTCRKPTNANTQEWSWCLYSGLGMMTKQSIGLPLEIFARAQDHSTEESVYSSFIMWGFSGNSPGFVNCSSITNKGEDGHAKYSGHIYSCLASSGQYRMLLRCPVFKCMWPEQACNVVVTGANKISLLQSSLSALPLYLALCVAAS